MQTTNNTREIYLPDHVYDELREQLENLVAEEFEECTGRRGIDPKSAIDEVLGNVGNIWPASVLDDAEVAAAA